MTTERVTKALSARELDQFAIQSGKRKKYIGKCIYCGSQNDLTTEHALPESLNGDLELLKASCKVCAVITGRFEGRYTGETLKPARTVMGMKSKRPNRTPKTFPIEFITNGVSQTYYLSPEEYMAV